MIAMENDSQLCYPTVRQLTLFKNERQQTYLLLFKAIDPLAKRLDLRTLTNGTNHAKKDNNNTIIPTAPTNYPSQQHRVNLLTVQEPVI